MAGQGNQTHATIKRMASCSSNDVIYIPGDIYMSVEENEKFWRKPFFKWTIIGFLTLLIILIISIVSFFVFQGKIISLESNNLKESPWHLTVGGFSQESFIKSVELYNWKTGKQCLIQPLPQGLSYSMGTELEGKPLVCGGASSFEYFTKICHYFETDTQKWIQTTNLKVPTAGASSVNIPGLGWFLFGGNNEKTSQKLGSIGSEWENGPEVKSAENFAQCAIQISPNVTAFIGGMKLLTNMRFDEDNINHGNIYTLNWSRPKPTQVKDEMSLRYLGRVMCGLIHGQDGLPVVAMVGKEKGMQIWNPRASSVETVHDEMPAEKGGQYGLYGGEIISIKGGEELLLYGGQVFEKEIFDDIWRYVVSENKWTRIGKLLVPRTGHVTFPVSGLECPP